MTDDYEIYAEQIIVHKVRSAWFEMSRMFSQVASASNITLSVGFTLIAIYEEEGTPVTKIAPRMGMEPNSLSRLLKSMETDGLVERVPDARDKRKVLVKLTEKGHEKRKVSIKSVFRLNNAMLGDLDPIKVKHFYEVINSVPKSTSKTLDKMLKEMEDSN
ncbi:MAG: MarR family transcriptional regulator [Flavobacteriales bacterium]|jgi:DNA-binding MarR family transcriptional regulator|tara:strand:- start:471 stop:950 length:480 start_codon:yes stop_codon:yes gene_type:complete